MKFEQLIGAVALGILSWGSLQLYQMNASMTLVTYKVEENYKMIKPMWQDFLARQHVARFFSSPEQSSREVTQKTSNSK